MQNNHTDTHDEEQRHREELRMLTPGERLALRMEIKAQRKRARGRRKVAA